MHLTLVEKKKTREGEGYILRTQDNYPVLSTSKALNDEEEGKNKWKIGISISSGCPVGCIYCFTNHFASSRKLSAGEIAGQAEIVISESAHIKSIFDEVKVEMKEMGDPLMNPANTIAAIHEMRTKHPGFLYVVSTSGPHNPSFFKYLKEERDSGTKIRLQFSCHTTDNQARKRLSPVIRMMTLEDIANATGYFSREGERVTLNFVPISGYPIDTGRIASLFDPKKVFLKISYIDDNSFTIKHNIFGKNKEEIGSLAREFGELGFKYAHRNLQGRE
jgi:adenine C2-methylase RlmN of 23S rRNA A2503 and tRNA A37